jgi:hypothetical protein
LEQKSAWMMTPGSVFGLEGLNDWARRKKLPGALERGQTPRVACQAIGPLWVLELPAERFDAALLSESNPQVLATLLEHVATCIYSPEIVAAMRQSPQFIRAPAMHLYKLLEWAPTKLMLPNNWDQALDPNQGEPIQGDLGNGKLLGGPAAVYYVIEGSLRLTVGAKVMNITAGEMEGAELFRSQSQDDVSEPVCLSKTLAVMLTQSMLHAYIRQAPGFARCLGPRNEQEGA